MPATSAAHEIALQPGIPFLAEYVIERMLERGEDWALYIARHATRTTERFRIRVVRSESALHPEGVDLQLARAARLSRLDHPGIVPYVTSGLDPDRGLVAVVSRHLLGITLRERFERGGKKLTRAEIARIVCELGDALDCLHDLHPPIVHGRLDASRVLLAAPDAGVRLIGLEESVESGDRPALDQFALASIAFECLTGRAPFGAGATVASDPMPRLDRFDTPTGTSADLDWVLQRAWSTDESRRFAGAGRLAVEIARLLGEPGAVEAARLRRTERAIARATQSGSGTQRAVRPPTLPSMPAARAGVPEKRPSGANLAVPNHAPSGERPAILPNAGRYAIHNERTPRPRATTATVTAIPMPKPMPTLPLPTSAGVSARTPSTLRTPTLVGAPAIPSGPAALVPAPVAEAPAAPVARTPTLVGAPPAPSAPAALVSAPETPVPAATLAVAPITIDPEPLFECDVEVLDAVSAVASGAHRAVDAATPDASVPSASVAPPPVAAIAPTPPAPIVAVPPAPILAAAPVPPAPPSRSEPPPAASAFMSAILDARATAPVSSEPVIEFDPFPSIPPPAFPIPLVANPRPREASPSQIEQAQRRARVAPRPRGRRFIHLVGAIGLALLFGGAEKLAPHVPAARRWVSQWINPPHAITPIHVPAIVPAAPIPAAPVPQPPIVATPTIAAPSASDRAHATAAWRAVVEDCSTRVARDRRHARFTVTYEGTTGAAVDVSFGDPFFRTHAIGACIADGARNVHVEPFTDRQWTGNYAILVP